MTAIAKGALQDALIGRRRPTAPEATALCAGLAAVVLSWMVRLWLFTPHTILWGMLVPLWALAVGQRVLAPGGLAGDRVPRRAAMMGGLAALAYPFTVLVPAVLLAALGGQLQCDGIPSGLARWLRAAAFAAVAFVLPTLAWIGVSYAVAGGYYDHAAMAYRQFRWLPDALATGGPGAAWAVAVGRAKGWSTAIATQLAAPAVFLVSLVVACVATGTSLRTFATRHRALLGSAALVLTLGAAFWYLDSEMGAGRAATLAPVVEVIAAALALELDGRRGRARWAALLAGVTIVWGAAQMLRPVT